MENKKENCENLVKRWKELESKVWGQNPDSVGNLTACPITPEEITELSNTKKELKNYLEFLSVEDRLDIENYNRN